MTLSDPLCDAAFAGDVEALVRLLDAGEPVGGQRPDAIPLHTAVEGGHPRCVRLLLDRGADVHRCDSAGWTALDVAVDAAIDGTIQQGGSPGDEPTEIIEILLRAGARRERALKIAQEYGSAKVEQLLNAPGRGYR